MSGLLIVFRFSDICRVVDNLRLKDGNLFSMPICLDVSKETVEGMKIKAGSRLALVDFRDDRQLAIITVSDVYKPDKSVCFRPLSS